MGRALTEALHGIRAEDLAGSFGPEVVTGNVFTVAPTEHQLVAVFFLLRFRSPWVKTPRLYKTPLQACWGGGHPEPPGPPCGPY